MLSYPRFGELNNEVFRAGVGLLPEQINQIKQEVVQEASVCSICLENLDPGSVAMVIPGCLHKFHASCIHPWLTNNSICPYCRNVINMQLNN
jgi:Ring finger domain